MSEYLELKERCYRANMEIPERGLAIYTFGNVSVADRERGVVAIKPSGVDYQRLTAEDIVVLGMDGERIEGTLRPSSDTRTHLVLYQAFPSVGAVVHTHSTHAVGWAQAQRSIPILGTTHADHTIEDIPCTRPMSAAEIEGDYEQETGNLVVSHFRDAELDASRTEMVLVGNHGPFAWGTTPEKAVYNAVVLEEIARMAWIALTINPNAPRLSDALRRKHFERKHGPDAYYGQT